MNTLNALLGSLLKQLRNIQSNLDKSSDSAQVTKFVGNLTRKVFEDIHTTIKKKNLQLKVDTFNTQIESNNSSVFDLSNEVNILIEKVVMLKNLFFKTNKHDTCTL